MGAGVVEGVWVWGLLPGCAQDGASGKHAGRESERAGGWWFTYGVCVQSPPSQPPPPPPPTWTCSGSVPGWVGTCSRSRHTLPSAAAASSTRVPPPVSATCVRCGGWMRVG